MMRSLAEWIGVETEPQAGEEPTGPNDDLAYDNALQDWSGVPYAELSYLLAWLRYLSMLHQTHHWIAKGDSFYGDHELFAKLYERTLEDVDEVAEKAVGLGTEQNAALASQIVQIMKICRAFDTPQTVPQSSELAKASLAAERMFLKTLTMTYQSMQQASTLTPGVDNMIQQVADRHEKHVYLLGRKCAAGALGF